MTKTNRINAVHRIDLPRIVQVGESILDKLCDICDELGFIRALIVTGETTYKVAGSTAQELLLDSGTHTDCIFVKDATMDTVERVKTKVKKDDVDVVLGIGGGRNIDVAKLAASETSRFFISVPTVASHDGIASSLASVKGMGRPYTARASSPIAVVMDSKIIAESPYRYTASGCGDIICKATEVRDWWLAHKENDDYYGGYAGSLSLMSSEHVMKSADLIKERTQEGIRTVLEALVSLGVAMSIAGSSRPSSGSAHLFSHALDMIAEKPALHGEQCGVGGIMMAKLHGLKWKEIKGSLGIIGAPTTAEELGIDADTIIKALTMAQSIRPERYTILSKIKLDEKKAKELAESTEVI
ncbi:MAG: NAD(P)-dependent glycerol-1-phosphate dehydrogenase [Candidatus Bathyarchaeota archaeon]|nr:NAD(P)-dependent glycerol-1-phosphate dehydrogenase [Candidatus Bathyarchaeota archaeon]